MNIIKERMKEIILEETKENIEFYNKEVLKKLLKGKIKVKISILRDSPDRIADEEQKWKMDGLSNNGSPLKNNRNEMDKNYFTGGGNWKMFRNEMKEHEEITIPYRIFYTGMEKIKKIFEVKDPPEITESVFSFPKFPRIFNKSPSSELARSSPAPPAPLPSIESTEETPLPSNEMVPPSATDCKMDGRSKNGSPLKMFRNEMKEHSTTNKIKITIFGEEEEKKNDYKELLEEWKWIKTAIEMKLYIADYEKYKINKKIILIGEVQEWDETHNEETIKEEFKEKNKVYLDKYENTELFKEVMN
jgi:hypothetical protein